MGPWVAAGGRQEHARHKANGGVQPLFLQRVLALGTD